MSYYCKVCGLFDAINNIRTHECAINNAINSESDQRSAVEGVRSGLVDASREGASGDDRLRSGVPEVRTANRRTREAYNAYMKEYMRKRRMKHGSDHR